MKTLDDLKIEVPLEIALKTMFNAYLHRKGLVNINTGDGQLQYIGSTADPELLAMIKDVLARYEVNAREL